MGEADAHVAELRHALDDLARDEVEAARPRAQGDLALVPHAPGG